MPQQVQTLSEELLAVVAAVVVAVVVVADKQKLTFPDHFEGYLLLSTA